MIASRVGELSRYQRWYGRDEPPMEMRELRAGPLALWLEGIDLRYGTLGDVEIVRRLFVAVRDAAWGTIAPVVSAHEVDEEEDSFRVSFQALNAMGDMRFRWRGHFAGTSEGTLECELDGRAETDFLYNRIGFCVLHPRENQGRPYRARTPEGDLEGALPVAIGQQLVVDGLIQPLFPSFSGLDIEVADGLKARFEFEGDLFEMEDQRNWTDASFKTYSTPLRLGFPHQARAGQTIRQRVVLSLEGDIRRPRRSRSDGIAVTLGEHAATLPSFALGSASHGAELSGREATLLRDLAPSHLRADLHLTEGGWATELERAVATAGAVDAALELALFVGEYAEAELDALGDALTAAAAPVARVLVFQEGAWIAGAQLVRLVRERLGPDPAYVGGTQGWFVDLNRNRPQLDGLDGVAFSINATVHAEDDLSVRETPAAQGDTVRSARAFCGNLPIVVSPVTIRPPSWPFGELPPRVCGLPFQVDVRQPSLFGAAWTLASAKHLAEAGAASVTYFETTGWRGVIETEAGPPLDFPSRPGMVFPVYHVLRDLCEWRGGEIVAAVSDEPLAVEAVAVRAMSGLHVLAASLVPETQRVSFSGIFGGTARVRTLDEDRLFLAAEDPEAFRAQREPREVRGGRLELELPPYAVVRVDA